MSGWTAASRDDFEQAMSGLNNLALAIARWRMANGADPNHHNKRVLQSRLMGLVTEIAEASDDVRHDQWSHLPEEMADIFIRWIGIVGFLNIDIERAIRDKMAINLSKGAGE